MGKSFYEITEGNDSKQDIQFNPESANVKITDENGNVSSYVPAATGVDGASYVENFKIDIVNEITALILSNTDNFEFEVRDKTSNKPSVNSDDLVGLIKENLLNTDFWINFRGFVSSSFFNTTGAVLKLSGTILKPKVYQVHQSGVTYDLSDSNEIESIYANYPTKTGMTTRFVIEIMNRQDGLFQSVLQVINNKREFRPDGSESLVGSNALKYIIKNRKNSFVVAQPMRTISNEPKNIFYNLKPEFDDLQKLYDNQKVYFQYYGFYMLPIFDLLKGNGKASKEDLNKFFLDKRPFIAVEKDLDGRAPAEFFDPDPAKIKTIISAFSDLSKRVLDKISIVGLDMLGSAQKTEQELAIIKQKELSFKQTYGTYFASKLATIGNYYLPSDKRLVVKYNSNLPMSPDAKLDKANNMLQNDAIDNKQAGEEVKEVK